VRGVTRPRTLKGASLASLRRLSTKCPTSASAFLISVPQSHKSRKSSRARFSTLFSCAIRRAALAWYCAIKNVHFRWYYTCACHDRWTVMASVCLPRNYTEREKRIQILDGIVSVSRARLFDRWFFQNLLQK
jgi:hypothetical protein